VSIKRGAKTIIPIGSDQILANDIVYFMTTPDNLESVRKKAGKEDYQIKTL
jgi:trk system potassium uptake protein TrkA